MSVTIVIPGYLRDLVEGDSTVALDGEPATVAQAFDELRARHPALHRHVFTEQGELRRHVNVFVGRDDIRWSGGLETAIEGGAEIIVLPAVSGG